MRTTSARALAATTLGLVLVGAVASPASAMLSQGRVRVSSSSNVLTVPTEDETAARVNLRWEKLTVPFA